MTKAEFDTLRTELAECADKVLNQKRRAYAGDADVLANFTQLANEVGLTPVKVWEVLMRKALNAMIRTANGEDLGGESAIERFVDFRNYVDLGFALSRQRPPAEKKRFIQFERYQPPIMVTAEMVKEWAAPFSKRGEVPSEVPSPKAANRILDDQEEHVGKKMTRLINRILD